MRLAKFVVCYPLSFSLLLSLSLSVALFFLNLSPKPLYQTVSLLGTWQGKGIETWNEQSTLLQVFVSIQGLILGTAEPYYLEPGYPSFSLPLLSLSMCLSPLTLIIKP